MKDMRTLMPVLARGGGRWEGRYVHLAPDFTELETYEVHCASCFPGDGSADYRLDTRNIYPDGTETRASHLANWRDGRLWWQGALTGWMAEVDDRTLYLRFGFRDDPAIEICEMIQMSDDGRSRARTWHWFRHDRLIKITLTEERRVE